MWRSCDCVGGGGNLDLKILQIRGNVAMILAALRKVVLIGGGWDIKAYYDLLICEEYIV